MRHVTFSLLFHPDAIPLLDDNPSIGTGRSNAGILVAWACPTNVPVEDEATGRLAPDQCYGRVHGTRRPLSGNSRMIRVGRRGDQLGSCENCRLRPGPSGLDVSIHDQQGGRELGRLHLPRRGPTPRTCGSGEDRRCRQHWCRRRRATHHWVVGVKRAARGPTSLKSMSVCITCQGGEVSRLHLPESDSTWRPAASVEMDAVSLGCVRGDRRFVV